MTEDLIAMAAQAGFPDCQPENHPFVSSGDFREAHEEFLTMLGRFAALIEARAVARTREECAKCVEQTGPREGPLKLVTDGFALAIRTLGERT